MYSRQGDKKSPSIEFDTEKGMLDITGVSIPENPHDVYVPLVQAVAEYKDKVQGSAILNFKLYYFNTSTSKYLLDIIKAFIQLRKEKDMGLTINWYYHDGDEDMLEIGEDFQDLLDYPFNFVPE